MARCTLAFGNYTAPCTIEGSVPNVWLPSDMLSVAYFVTNPPTTYPTRAKHLLRIASTATSAEREFLLLLSQSLTAHGKRYGILDFRQACGCLGILSTSSIQPADLFVLQIVDIPSNNDFIDPSSSSLLQYPPLAPDRLPMEMLQAINERHTPEGEQRMKSIAQEMYRIASVYGYWDLWRVLEGICQRFNIDPQQLI
ncbi:predicted protein [Lichtheimia corymbifera JMRC:FSU:9682]|uniref:Uncharacterized protein n=1 Tax=Lichtheimia corymbifera JMRC:FSU:9682 TaxID=1263082 RepID=A0A068RLA0_9FUNG|nr:predicted protein [Lichtheimia corymbifera JMRC:FSU:9682]